LIEKINDEKRRSEDEKRKMEELVARDKLVLNKQLNELKDNYEKQIREKNENILRLNNLLNDNLDNKSKDNA